MLFHVVVCLSTLVWVVVIFLMITILPGHTVRCGVLRPSQSSHSTTSSVFGTFSSSFAILKWGTIIFHLLHSTLWFMSGFDTDRNALRAPSMASLAKPMSARAPYVQRGCSPQLLPGRLPVWGVHLAKRALSEVPFQCPST
jgi:hypothetical protein